MASLPLISIIFIGSDSPAAAFHSVGNRPRPSFSFSNSATPSNPIHTRCRQDASVTISLHLLSESRQAYFQLFDSAQPEAPTKTIEELLAEGDGSDEDDVPRPTANGGFSHTAASRAKISKANKGKTPWNKGQGRSEETKARIAAGVRARNRERFLQKLKDLNMTEEEYNQQKKEDRARKERERRARQTEKGGYRHSPETKKKISKILKEKYASGQVKKREIDPSKVRRGFKHTEETRARIAASLRKKWAEDDEYRKRMLEKTAAGRNDEETRRKISETLKKRWQDDEFRAKMMDKLGNRQLPNEHRERISAALTAKWQDPAYRKRMLDAAAKQRTARGTPKPKQPRAAKPKLPKVKKANAPKKKKVSKRPPALEVIQPRAPRTPKPRGAPALVKPMTSEQSSDEIEIPRHAIPVDPMDAIVSEKKKAKKKAKKKKKKKPQKPGDKDLMREERRDLYDLLYGDEEGSPVVKNHLGSVFELGDEDLDDFDPYGLDDF